MTQTKKIIGIALWVVLSLSFLHEIRAQQRLSFEGDYQLGPFNGRAAYSYQVVGIDTIYEGDFVFERSNLSSLLKKRDSSFLIRGSFQKNIPEGEWLFQFGEFQSDSTTQVKGFNYQVKVDGRLQEAFGNLAQGKPNGTWAFSDKEVKKSSVVDTLFFSEINFLNGIPQQTFRLENQKGALIGRLLRNGLAHDTWSLISNEGNSIENWYFSEGRLIKIENQSDSFSVTTPVFDATIETFEEENLDKGFISLLKIYTSDIASSKISGSGVASILNQNQSSYVKIKEVLSELGASDFGTGFKVLVPYFPLDENSAQQLDSISKWVKQAHRLSNLYINNTQLNLLRRSDTDANYLFHVTKALDSQYIRPLTQLADMGDYGVLDNISPVQLVQYLFPNGNPNAEISFSIDKGRIETFTGPEGEDLSFTPNTIESLHQMAAYVKSSMQQVSASLEDKLVDDKKQKEFEELEKQMIDRVNALNNYPDSIQQILNNRQTKALSKIKEFAEHLLSAYAEKDSNTKTLDGAKNLVECLGHLDVLSDEVVKLSENERLLEEKYTDAVFNPFTATIMDERVKKRITGAYRNVIIPYLLDAVEQQLSCGNAESLHVLYVNVQERMLELRDEDSSKMERKLRKERNPKVVLELFNLKPIGK